MVVAALNGGYETGGAGGNGGNLYLVQPFNLALGAQIGVGVGANAGPNAGVAMLQVFIYGLVVVIQKGYRVVLVVLVDTLLMQVVVVAALLIPVVAAVMVVARLVGALAVLAAQARARGLPMVVLAEQGEA